MTSKNPEVVLRPFQNGASQIIKDIIKFILI